MSSPTNKPNPQYFFEKDRTSSFKTWPFTEREPCSITKVCNSIGISWENQVFFYPNIQFV